MGKVRKMTATTFAGLEEMLGEELLELGARRVSPVRRAVEFEGDTRLIYRVAIRSRLALRVLVPIRRMKFRTADDMYRQALTIAWDRSFTLDDTFAIRVSGNHPAFTNTMFAAQRLKDAIADSFRKRHGKRPSVDTKDPLIPINLHLSATGASVSLDASGEPLFQRGWRKETGEAPLNELLAAAILMHTGYDGSQPFVDAMTGSGTIGVEAALFARRIVPGMHGRFYAFQNWHDFDSVAFEEEIIEAKQELLDRAPATIVCADEDKAAIGRARRNAENAALEKDIRFHTSKFANLQPPAEEGILVMNPPYDERLEVDDVGKLYEEIGDVLKQRWSGWRAFVFTGNLQAAKRIGLRTSRRIPMMNGGIDCRLLEFDLYKGSRKHAGESAGHEDAKPLDGGEVDG